MIATFVDETEFDFITAEPLEFIDVSRSESSASHTAVIRDGTIKEEI